MAIWILIWYCSVTRPINIYYINFHIRPFVKIVQCQYQSKLKLPARVNIIFVKGKKNIKLKKFVLIIIANFWPKRKYLRICLRRHWIILTTIPTYNCIGTYRTSRHPEPDIMDPISRHPGPHETYLWNKSRRSYFYLDFNTLIKTQFLKNAYVSSN